MEIRHDDLRGPEIAALLQAHLDDMHRHSPPESVHALDLDALRAPDITFWTVWDEGVLLGCGALRELDPQHGEIKSMRTHPDHLRAGVGRALLRHIIAVAMAEGLRRLSLETGSGPAFDPALTLYRAHGFRDGPAFGDYVRSDFNQFLHRDLE